MTTRSVLMTTADELQWRVAISRARCDEIRSLRPKEGIAPTWVDELPPAEVRKGPIMRLLNPQKTSRCMMPRFVRFVQQAAEELDVEAERLRARIHSLHCLEREGELACGTGGEDVY